MLVVSDDQTFLGALERLLDAEGLATVVATDGEAALVEAGRSLPDVVLVDLQMAGMAGVELCRRLHDLDGSLPVIVMTTMSEMATAIESLRVEAEDCLVKPPRDEALLWSVRRALARRDATVEQERLRLEAESLSRVVNERLVLSSIREHEHAEAEALQREQLNALIGHLSEGVAIADPGGRIVLLNAAARAMLGTGDEGPRTVDELQALVGEDLHGNPLPSDQRPLARALRGEQFANYEVVRVGRDGNRRRVVSTGTSVRDGHGHVALAIVLFHDVTELRHLEQQREEFLALITHDLRNPLTSILMLVARLKRFVVEKAGVIEKKQYIVDLAERAERNLRRMSGMLEELTEVTTLEAGGA
jgi:PAS domain S-box-containing protein